MYARVMTFNGVRGKGDEATAWFRDTLVPAAKARGAKGVLLVGATDLGKAVHIVVWDSWDAMMDAEAEDAFSELFAEMERRFLCGPPMREGFEAYIYD